HEPGFHYNADKGEFEEIHAQGLVLGVVKHTYYAQYDLELQSRDDIVLLTDGVTVGLRSGSFITCEEGMVVVVKDAHLPAQEQANQVYLHFYELDDFELKDDFTLLIIKKNV